MNGDWFTYLLILIFFVFPLIQQILEARRRGPPPAPPSEDTLPEGWTVPGELPSRRESGPPVATESGGSWSDAWGSWPEATPSPEAVGSDLPELTEVVQELPEMWGRDFPEPEVEPSPEPVYATVESYDLPPVVEPRAERLVVPVSVTARQDNLAMRSRESLGFLRRASSRSGLRDAIVLAEVLGPPKSLRFEDPENERS